MGGATAAHRVIAASGTKLLRGNCQLLDLQGLPQSRERDKDGASAATEPAAKGILTDANSLHQ
jgi:hypothetical protein